METPKPTVVVLDGEQRAALAVVRSLGRRGCSVHVGSSVPSSLAGGSHYAVSETLLPDPMADATTFSLAVAQLVKLHDAHVLLPISEASTLALLERPALFQNVLIPTPDLDHFRRASDKAAVLQIARDIGMEVPAQWIVATSGWDPNAVPLEAYPVVVKSARSVVESEGGRLKTGVSYADSPAALSRTLFQLAPDAYPVLIQNRIEGPGLGVFLLRWDGNIVASFAHRRIREKPPSGGVSVCCESVAPPVGLVERSAALLRALDWAGVAMVELKQDSRSGQTYLMEVNPRFWGSLQLAIDAGVDFPWYLISLALGAQIRPAHEWQVGLRSRWLWGDIDHLIARIRRTRGELNLPAGAPGLVRTALSILNPFRSGQQSDVLRFSDPAPFFRETAAWVRALKE